MTIHGPAELVEDPNVALQMLREGNERFTRGALIDKCAYSADRDILNSGQKPFAVVITCSDSRVAPELYFDQKLGDIFVIRNAGNIADTTALGSLEFAVAYLKSKLIAVVGHTGCGAVTAACGGGEVPPNIAHIINHIKPAIEKGGDVDACIRANVENMVEKIKADDIVKSCNAMVVGAIYDIRSGRVNWL